MVVIAIIGILSVFVGANLFESLKKGRDGARASAVSELDKALQLYYVDYEAYPPSLASLVPKYMQKVPVDPNNSSAYSYVAYAASSGAATCVAYHLGISLETSSYKVLTSDADISSPPSGFALCTGFSVDIDGNDANKCASGDAGSYCYDIYSH